MMMEFGRDINQLGVSPKEMRMEQKYGINLAPRGSS